MNQRDTESSTIHQSKEKRQKSASHPRYTLEQAVAFAKAVYMEGPFNVDQEKLAKRIKYSGAKNGAYIGLRAAASAFGLVSTSGDTVSLTGEWNDILFSDNDSKFKKGLKDAIRKPTLYKQLFDDYEGRQLPDIEKLARVLYTTPKYQILKDASNTAAKIFIESADYAKILNSRGYTEFQDFSDNEGKKEDLTSDIITDYSPKQGISVVASKPNLLGQELLTPMGLENLDRIEVRLSSGQKAYLFLPVPLPRVDKDRLKAYIDLLIEEPFSTGDSS